MTGKSVFDFDSYKLYLKAFFDLPDSAHGIRSQFAKAVDCQSSFVSQLLTGKAELSLDQAYRATTFLGHSLDEAEFFILLVQLHRSTDAGFKKYLHEKIQKIRSERTNLKNRVATNKEISLESRAQYYSSWIYTAVHVAASLKPSKSPQEMAAYLNSPIELINQVIQFLETLGLVHLERGIVTMGPTHIHLPSDSVLVKTHHLNWRAKAIHALDQNQNKNLHYSVVYSLSRKDAEAIKRKIADLIQENLKVVAPSEEEVLFANAIDFFELG